MLSMILDIIYNVRMSKCRYCGKQINEGEEYCCEEHRRRHALMHTNRDLNVIGIVICLLLAIISFFFALVTSSKIFIGIAIILFGIMICFMNGIDVGDYYSRLFTMQRGEKESWHEETGIFKYLTYIIGGIVIIGGLLIIFI